MAAGEDYRIVVKYFQFCPNYVFQKDYWQNSAERGPKERLQGLLLAHTHTQSHATASTGHTLQGVFSPPITNYKTNFLFYK